MCLIRKTFLFLLFCLSATAHAQRALLRHYTVQDGLPSNTIYDMFQDRRGFIWFSTDQGISRFDGHTFRNFSIRDGLPDNEIFSVGEDDYHRYWVACYNHRACYLKDGKVYNATNDQLCREIEQAGIQYHMLYRDIDGHCCLSGKKIAVIGKDHVLLKDITAEPGASLNGTFAHDGQEYIISSREIYRIEQGRKVSLLKAEIKSSICVGNDLLVFRFDKRIPLLETWRFEGNQLQLKYRIRPASWVYHLLPGKGAFIACTETGQFLYQPSTGTYTALDNLPPNTCNNRWMQDTEGNEWFSTINNGIYMQLRATPHIYDDQSGLQQNNILAVHVSPYGDLLAGNDRGVISLINGSLVHNFLPEKSGYTNRVRFIYAIGKHELISGSDWGVQRVNTATGKHRTIFIDAFKAGVVRGDHCLFASSGKALRYNIANGELSAYWMQRTTAIEESRDGTVWLGTLDGLYYRQGGQISLYRDNAGLIHQRITCLVVTPKDALGIGTSTNGLFIHTKDTLLHLNEDMGLSSNSCRKMITDTAGNLWLCTDNGLDRIDLQDFPRYRIYNYTLSDGLQGNKLNDIAIKGDQLYLATSAGIVVLNSQPNDRLPPQPPRLYITSVDDQDIALARDSGIMVRNYDQNDLQVAYTGISFAVGDDVQYKYFLEGARRDTIFTTNRVINFSALSPGDYQLRIWARNKNGPWTVAPAELPFSVLPPWWRKPWFQILTAFLLLLSAYLIYRRRIRQVQMKAERTVATNRQMAELEMKALRAQINPHFIFNALNSIQTYYSNNDELRANHYMTVFAQFVRKTLTHSQSHWLPLSEELLMLQTYIELEQMRFKQVFSFELLIGENVWPDQIVVPAMLIQPYVENAINHGLRHLKDRPGALVLRFTLRDQSLVCIVDDNGVGFQAAQKNKSVNHQSFGMHINRQRIETINQLYSTSIQMTVTDKQALDDTQYGTTIGIIIPLKMNTDHAEHFVS